MGANSAFSLYLAKVLQADLMTTDLDVMDSEISSVESYAIVYLIVESILLITVSVLFTGVLTLNGFCQCACTKNNSVVL